MVSAGPWAEHSLFRLLTPPLARCIYALVPCLSAVAAVIETAQRARLLIHIGAGKCGSSAIQWFLARNQAKLRARGYLLPGPRLEPNQPSAGQQVWYFNECLQAPDQQGAAVRARLLELAQQDGAPTIVLSAENLLSARQAPGLFQPLGEQFDIRILGYIRRQDDYLLSFWQQWGFKQAPDFWAWLVNMLQPGRPGDWLADLEPWARAFGDTAICLRRFGQAYFLGGDLLHDFCAAANIDTTDLELMQPPQNLGFNDTLMEAAYRLRDRFTGPHDIEFFEMAARWAGPSVCRRGASRQLNYAQRLAILEHFAAGNRALQHRFFPELPADQPLFEPPCDLQEPDSPPSSERAQIDLCLRLLHGAYRDIRGLQRRLDQQEAAKSTAQH